MAHVNNTTQETKQNDRKNIQNIVRLSVNINFKTCRGRQYLQFIFLRSANIIHLLLMNDAQTNCSGTKRQYPWSIDFDGSILQPKWIIWSTKRILQPIDPLYTFALPRPFAFIIYPQMQWKLGNIEGSSEFNSLTVPVYNTVLEVF